eukprot:363869-Chlamydomonas_euryale.AAC.27
MQVNTTVTLSRPQQAFACREALSCANFRTRTGHVCTACGAGKQQVCRKQERCKNSMTGTCNHQLLRASRCACDWLASEENDLHTTVKAIHFLRTTPRQHMLATSLWYLELLQRLLLVLVAQLPARRSGLKAARDPARARHARRLQLALERVHAVVARPFELTFVDRIPRDDIHVRRELVPLQ